MSELQTADRAQYAPARMHDMVGTYVAMCDQVGIQTRHMNVGELYDTATRVLHYCRDRRKSFSSLTPDEKMDCRDHVLGVAVINEPRKSNNN
jgi:hypothetical protein